MLAGGTGPDALEVGNAAARLNQSLGGVGVTVRPDQAYTGMEGAATHRDIRAIADRMRTGQVSFLMVRGVNPAFDTPKSAGFAEAMARVPFKVSFSTVPDETTMLCDLVLPDHHALESWGDAQPVRDTIALRQPVMEPVFLTRQTGDVLLQVAKGDAALAPLTDQERRLLEEAKRLPLKELRAECGRTRAAHEDREARRKKE